MSKERIVVDADGELIIWQDGQLMADHIATVQDVQINAALHLPVELVWGVAAVEASLEDEGNLLAITAALLSVKPGRSRVLDAPESVLAWFDSHTDDAIH